MEKRSVLLVNDNAQESEFITSVLQDERIHVMQVCTGREALDALMGVENVPAFGRIVPDVIIIRNALPDITAFEVYNVLSNYFRFSHIEYYLIHDISDKVFMPPYSASIFESRLDRPVSPDSMAYRQLLDLKRKLLNNRRAMYIPLLGFLKGKAVASFTKTGVATSLKVAACIAGVGFAAVSLTSMKDDANTSLSNVELPQNVTYISGSTPAVTYNEVTDVPAQEAVDAAPEEITVQPATVISEPAADTTEAPFVAIQEPADDSVPTKKVFSIGVK